jgi:predicted AAA+ superfamily ATPase
MTGVKSITNMSGADLVSQGSLNKKGNLAQVKSIENMVSFSTRFGFMFTVDF